MTTISMLGRAAQALVLSMAALSAAALALPAAAQQSAAAPQRQQDGVYRYRLGDFQITVLSDGTVPQDLHRLLQGVAARELDRLLEQSFHRDPVEASINAYLVETGDRILLVDTGAGELFGPGNGGKLLDRLRAAGFEAGQVTDILLSHIHGDHSGGLTRGGQASFPNATVHVGKPDLDFFLAPQNQNGVNGYDKSYFQQGTASLSPYVAAGRVKAFSGPTSIAPGIEALPTPGHTPGHSFYRITSKGQSLVLLGDIIHVAAVQGPQPRITIAYDVDPRAAREQRLRQFRELAGSRALVAAPHLPFPGIGHLRAQGGGFEFVPVDFQDREPAAAR